MRKEHKAREYIFVTENMRKRLSTNFRQWLLGLSHDGFGIGDLAADFASDSDPRFATVRTITQFRAYLDLRHACWEAQERLEDAWLVYRVLRRNKPVRSA